MTIFTTRKQRLKWGEATVLLALLTALVVLGLSYFVRTYYQHNLKDYHPFDSERELQLQQARPEKR
jgi:hypothetical protein